ncbi:hypothetical protein [Paenarthrobacter sp. YJN-5]|uniref:hypothetical protein n=1 Tax=Paenarthrobacter sp. YJN-5 TaxID=2735316 RepID=UPI001877CA07|nr:hypothetical protein [Paenarthrobacter sp. YJN-5]QOT19626.1 hypothetical protein HMI59_23725 [Paenarthrobacter sp. YJN-5]
MAFVIAAGLVGCSAPATTTTTASPAAQSADFCGTVSTHRDRYLQTMNQPSGSDLAKLVTTLSAVGDLKLMWTDIAAVAPPEIKTDAVAARDAWSKAESAGISGNKIEALGNALLNSGSVSRVNAYIAAHCGAEYAPLGVQPTAQPTPTATKVAAEGVWTDRNGYKYRIVINGPVDYKFTSDIKNALPGKAIVSFMHATTGTIYNLTPGRNAPVPEDLKFMTAWRGGIACDTLFSKSDDNSSGLPDGACGRAFQVGIDAKQIPDGGSVTYRAASGLNLAISVDESSVEQLRAAFSSPDQITLVTGSACIVKGALC